MNLTALRGVPARTYSDTEAGFSIIEVVVGMLVLVLAVLGTTGLVEGGMSSTDRTAGREQGTSLARDLIERTRQIPYASTGMASAPAALRAALPASDAASTVDNSSFTVSRRNRTYTVTVTACTIDDPSDGAGVGDSTFCVDRGAVPAVGVDPTPTPTPAPGVSATVLGVQVALGGSLVDTVCAALGTPAVLDRLTTAVSRTAPVRACPGAATGGASAINFDDQPDDMRRVTVELSWGGRHPERLVQTTLLTNP